MPVEPLGKFYHRLSVFASCLHSSAGHQCGLRCRCVLKSPKGDIRCLRQRRDLRGGGKEEDSGKGSRGRHITEEVDKSSERWRMSRPFWNTGKNIIDSSLQIRGFSLSGLSVLHRNFGLALCLSLFLSPSTLLYCHRTLSGEKYHISNSTGRRICQV